MNNINQYILEKLKIDKNTKVHNSQEQEWDELIENWINTWSETDFDHLMKLIDRFLTYNSFNKDEDYEEFLSYENNDKFKKFLMNKFTEFQDDNKKQIQHLQK